MEGFLRDAAHVIPIAGTLQAMNDNDDWRVLAFLRLPLAMREQAGFGVDLKQPGFGVRDIEPPGHKGRGYRHEVAVFQERVRLKFRD